MSAPMLPQIGLALTGLIAIYLTQSRSEKQRRFACIFGILGQPFWFWATYQAEQWGMFALCFLYAASWIKGFWIHWLHPTFKASYPWRTI
jgi:hypothetical protein